MGYMNKFWGLFKISEEGKSISGVRTWCWGTEPSETPWLLSPLGLIPWDTQHPQLALSLDPLNLELQSGQLD